MVNQSNIKKTNDKVKVGNRDAVLYLGQRGGKYVKVKGEFVKYTKKMQNKTGGDGLDGEPSVNSYVKPPSEVDNLSNLFNNLNINAVQTVPSTTSSSVQVVAEKTPDEVEADKREEAKKTGNYFDLTGGKKKLRNRK